MMWKPLQKLKPGPAWQKMVMSAALTPVSTGVFGEGQNSERKGKILREKRVEYHAFISYGPLNREEQIRLCV